MSLKWLFLCLVSIEASVRRVRAHLRPPVLQRAAPVLIKRELPRNVLGSWLHLKAADVDFSSTSLSAVYVREVTRFLSFFSAEKQLLPT